MTRLGGKIAVVTGAGGGLGRAISLSFASEGASVICQDLDPGTVKETVEMIGAAGGPPPMDWVCDITESTAVDDMYEAVERRYGRSNVLVHCAGVARTPDDGFDSLGGNGAQITAMTDAGWQRMIDIHLNGAFYCTRAMLRRLVDAKESGSIIVISSIAGTSGWGPVHYAAAKAGLLGFIRSLARFSGPIGIRANAICPGVIDTPMTQIVPPQYLDGLKMITPLGRIGQPSDIAAAAVYLASDESGFVTGQALSPNGGLVIY